MASTTAPLRLGIAGLGTVGGGALRLLERHAELIASRAGRRPEEGLTSPAHIVDMLPTKSAPTSTIASRPCGVSKVQITRSLRAKSSGTCAAVAVFTL